MVAAPHSVEIVAVVEAAEVVVVLRLLHHPAAGATPFFAVPCFSELLWNPFVGHVALPPVYPSIQFVLHHLLILQNHLSGDMDDICCLADAMEQLYCFCLIVVMALEALYSDFEAFWMNPKVHFCLSVETILSID